MEAGVHIYLSIVTTV